MSPDRDRVTPDSPIITIDLSHQLGENGERRIWGRATIPKVDRELELVTRQAVEAALKNFMALPILHYNHTERPIGWVEKSYFGDDDGLYIEGQIKPTSDCDDIWKRVESGELTQFSIFGRRIEGNASCKLRPGHRDSPCITSALHLDSISVCPRGNAINGDSFLEIVKGWCDIVKASDSTSAMIHPVVDGVEKSEMSDDAGAPAPDPADQSSDQQSAMASVLQQILDRIDSLEERIDEMTSYEGEEADSTVQKGDDAEPGEDTGDEDEGGPDLNEILTTIGEALQIIIQMLDEMSGNDQEEDQPSGDEDQQVQKGEGNPPEPEPEEDPDDGYEDEEAGDEPGPESEEDEISKCPVQKAESSDPDPVPGDVDRFEEMKKARDDAKAEIDNLRSELENIKKSTLVQKTPVVIPEIKKGAVEGKSSNAGILGRLYGG